MPRRFKKIKFDGEQVFLQYEEGASFENEYTIKCKELPRPEMVAALEDLRPEVLLLCELPDSYLDRIDVRSVSLNYGGPAETMGATITARMKLYHSNCPLNLNTPNKPVEPYNTDCDYDDDTYEKMCLSEDCVDKLEVLIEEAEAYINGHRAQGSLFGEDSADKPEHPAA